MERIIKKKRFFLYNSFILSVLFGTLFCVVFGYYRYAANTIISAQSEKLLQIARGSMESLVAYMNNRYVELAELSQDEQVIKNLMKTSDEDLQKFSDFFSRHSYKFSFKNLLLIKPEGSVFFAYKHRDQFHIDLTQSPFNTTNLGRCFDQTMNTLISSASSYSYDYILGSPSLYIASPVFYQKQLIGFVAVQIDQKALFEITHNYFELGKTGEVIIAKDVGFGSIVIGELRNRPSAQFNLVEAMQEISGSSVQKAVLGEEGVSVESDYRGVVTLNARTYVPMLDWGLVVKIDLDEVTQHLFLFYYVSLILFVLTSLMLFFWMFFVRSYLVDLISLFLPGKIVDLLSVRNVISVFLLCISLASLIGLFMKYRWMQQKAVQETSHLVNVKMNYAASDISEELHKIMFRTQSIADDLSTGRLKKEDLLIRINRDLKENPNLHALIIAYAPYMYNNSQELYAPHIIRDGKQFTTEMIDTLYNYTDEKLAQVTDWYTKPIKKGSMWFEPSYDSLNKTIVAKYAVPFYESKEQQQPIGVVVAEYNIDNTQRFMQNLVFGQTGFSFLLSESGEFIYHPLSSLVKTEKTIFSWAQETSNKALFDVGKKILKSSKGRKHYIDPITGQSTWVTFTAVPNKNWSLAVLFIEDEVGITPVLMRQIMFKIIFSIMILLLILLVFIINVHMDNERSLKHYAVASSITLFIALLISIATIMRTTEREQKEGETVIASMTSLEAYLSEQRRQASAKYKPLIVVPTGIYLHSVAFPAIDQLKISGYVWQKYPLNKPDIPRNFRILNTIDFKKEMSYHKKTENVETIGWKVDALIRQLYDYSQYPFDNRQMVISFAPEDMLSNILLTPAMQDYDMGQEKFIGIQKGFQLPEYKIKDAFFSFYLEQKPTTFGFDVDEDLLNETTLQFNLILIRDTLNALIVYFLPVCIILFVLYAVFIKLSQEVIESGFSGRAIATYGSLLFALIVLHGNFRTKYPAGGFLYIEYLFFLTYVTIVIFVIHALAVTQSKNIQQLFNKITLLLKIFFWPVQFTCWVLVTMGIFY